MAEHLIATHFFIDGVPYGPQIQPYLAGLAIGIALFPKIFDGSKIPPGFGLLPRRPVLKFTGDEPSVSNRLPRPSTTTRLAPLSTSPPAPPLPGWMPLTFVVLALFLLGLLAFWSRFKRANAFVSAPDALVGTGRTSSSTSDAASDLVSSKHDVGTSTRDFAFSSPDALMGTGNTSTSDAETSTKDLPAVTMVSRETSTKDFAFASPDALMGTGNTSSTSDAEPSTKDVTAVTLVDAETTTDGDDVYYYEENVDYFYDAANGQFHWLYPGQFSPDTLTSHAWPYSDPAPPRLPTYSDYEHPVHPPQPISTDRKGGTQSRMRQQLEWQEKIRVLHSERDYNESVWGPGPDVRSGATRLFDMVHKGAKTRPYGQVRLPPRPSTTPSD